MARSPRSARSAWCWTGAERGWLRLLDRGLLRRRLLRLLRGFLRLVGRRLVALLHHGAGDRVHRNLLDALLAGDLDVERVDQLPLLPLELVLGHLAARNLLEGGLGGGGEGDLRLLPETGLGLLDPLRGLDRGWRGGRGGLSRRAGRCGEREGQAEQGDTGLDHWD